MARMQELVNGVRLLRWIKVCPQGRTVAEMVEEFGGVLSRRTVYRYLDALSLAGVTFEKDGRGRDVYYRVCDDGL